MIILVWNCQQPGCKARLVLLVGAVLREVVFGRLEGRNAISVSVWALFNGSNDSQACEARRTEED